MSTKNYSTVNQALAAYVVALKNVKKADARVRKAEREAEVMLDRIDKQALRLTARKMGYRSVKAYAATFLPPLRSVKGSARFNCVVTLPVTTGKRGVLIPQRKVRAVVYCAAHGYLRVRRAGRKTSLAPVNLPLNPWYEKLSSKMGSFRSKAGEVMDRFYAAQRRLGVNL